MDDSEKFIVRHLIIYRQAGIQNEEEEADDT